MKFNPLMICVLILLVIGTGVLIFSRQDRLVNDATPPSDDSNRNSESRIPTVATLMSDERSLSDVCYFLNIEHANSQLDRLDVFEAMVFHPDVKGALILSFWTDEPIDFWNNLPYFPVVLRESLPTSLQTLPIRPSQVMVVRLIGRLRKDADGDYWLENKTLLGYTVMTLEAARDRSSPPP